MARVHLLSFYGSRDPDDGYAERQQFLHRSAERHGAIDVQHPWDMARLIKTRFHAENKAVLDQPRGAGFWLWKPWLIRQILDEIAPGDFLMYHDVGRALSRTPGIGYQFRRPVTPLVDWAAAHDGMFPGIYVPIYGRNARWTKRDCFVLMDCDSEAYWNTPLIQAGMNVWQNTPRVRGFVDEWLAYCLDPRILTDQPSECGHDDFTDFQDHRHDQSVLTNLVLKRNVAVYNQPEQELFKQRDIDYIARRVAVDQLVDTTASRGRETLSEVAIATGSSRQHSNAAACYQLHLEERRHDELSVLDISHQSAEEYAFWQRYLPHAQITVVAPGATVESATRTDHPIDPDRVTVRSADPGHRPGLEVLCRRMIKTGHLDVIVVRGAITMHDQQLAIGVLFPMLNPGGHLFIENLETARPGYSPGRAEDLGDDGKNSTLNVIRRINIPEFRFTSRYFTLDEVYHLERHADTAGVHWSPEVDHGIAVIRRKT